MAKADRQERRKAKKTAPPQSNGRPVVFIHGLWLHASSWQPWVEQFNQAGYKASAPGWPGFPDTVKGCRDNPEQLAGKTIKEVVDHYAAIISKMKTKPVVIGHSFGGLIAQLLLDRDLVAGAIAIDPAPIKGVLLLPRAQIMAAKPILGNPRNASKAISLTPTQFKYAFTNVLSDTESDRLFLDWTIPAPGKPLWQSALANFNPHAENKVDTRKDRAPLLLMAGGQDHTVPAKTTRIVKKLYRKSPAVTDLKEWGSRSHSLTIDNGWHELADYSLEWLLAHDIV